MTAPAATRSLPPKLVLARPLSRVAGGAVGAAAFGGLVVAGAAMMYLASEGRLPFVPSALAPFVSVGAVLAGGVLACLALHLIVERSGEVTLLPEGIVEDDGRDRSLYPWLLFRDFSDARSESVALRFEQQLPHLRRTLLVPAPSESKRVAVLAFLDGVGLPRAEDEGGLA